MRTKEDIYRILGSSNHSESERVKDDFYSTPKIAVDKLFLELEKLNIKLPKTIIEPSVGTGSIAYPLCEKGYGIMAFDIIDRGFPNTNVLDWLTVSRPDINELAIVANFPYNKIQEHTEHSLSLLKDGEYLIELAKIQFLEGKARRKMFKENPPKYVLVFSERIKCLANGKDSGGSSAICFCWYVFQKGFKGMPQVDWL
jgi:hypothetical protein